MEKRKIYKKKNEHEQPNTFLYKMKDQGNLEIQMKEQCDEVKTHPKLHDVFNLHEKETEDAGTKKMIMQDKKRNYGNGKNAGKRKVCTEEIVKQTLHAIQQATGICRRKCKFYMEHVERFSKRIDDFSQKLNFCQ